MKKLNRILEQLFGSTPVYTYYSDSARTVARIICWNGRAKTFYRQNDVWYYGEPKDGRVAAWKYAKHL